MLVGVPLTLLLAFSMFHADRQQIFGINALGLGLLRIVSGSVVYALMAALVKAGKPTA